MRRILFLLLICMVCMPFSASASALPDPEQGFFEASTKRVVRATQTLAYDYAEFYTPLIERALEMQILVGVSFMSVAEAITQVLENTGNFVIDSFVSGTERIGEVAVLYTVPKRIAGDIAYGFPEGVSSIGKNAEKSFVFLFSHEKENLSSSEIIANASVATVFTRIVNDLSDRFVPFFEASADMPYGY